ncbi:tRNA (5-methylaminomethyl-2-thiouridylate)-methyltransferase [secondary endosymbiont of Heteropsylla cubana]|uniref:tRNA-specific 2-thiouridylase MnmA n=1 Tax=secondary endosymbiont of Heteropsylla cubana TaxID=134287 RepID=J3TGV0_9ENTR|nr:tRNA 2-thiouridine(34) synthase MnmA [secondary endosymbiont of Heteropsylla cubana]AFP85747.1 tRNA (5-methylaminomethyl-2-thiouridylate)-methyltransferase [secondary endosymbiont of Heteropsylla cubana]
MSYNAKKIIVAMSGGVDSSVSAWLLKQQGYLVKGLFMKNWEEDDCDEYCNSKNDLEDTRSVCNTLGISLHTVNFSAEYWNNVFIHFLSEYKAGRTPNPDILCNKEIKFKSFLEFSEKELGADYIATGHYVRQTTINGKNCLLRGIDNNKDQSYFLYTLNHTQLSRCLFPIGTLLKSTVRRIASDLGLSIATKKDSTGICFIGKKKFRDFLGRYLPKNPGLIVSINGQELGYHQGLMYYTIGQRKGLGIGGTRFGSEKAWYVADKDMHNNLLIVTQDQQHPKLMSIGLTATHIHWVEEKNLTATLQCTVKTRYRQPDIRCLVTPRTDKYLHVQFDQPVAAVTPGQSVVFYLKERCLGGGVIKKRHPLIS